MKFEQLDLLEVGSYDGLFELAEIRQDCYQRAGGYFFEMEAVIKRMACYSDVHALPKPVGATQVCTVEKVSNETKKAEIQQPTLLETDSSDDVELFGSLWPLGEQVQLDATQNRERLRLQRCRLNELGYKFNATKQTWFKHMN